MEPFKDGKPVVTCDEDFDQSHVKGKTAIVTGGSNGMGEAYVRSLVAAGAFVVFGDVDDECGKAVAADVGSSAHFVHCDVSQWQSQLEMFKYAIANSPSHRVDIVIANAGISGFDEVFHGSTDLEEPEEPKLNILGVNGIGVLYTTKLALHYFRRQFKLDPQSSQDQLLIMQGSLAGYIDLPGSMQYGFCKYGMRAIMRNLRHSEHASNIRINYIAPAFVDTKILSRAAVARLRETGIPFATTSDAALAVMKFCSDPSINGRSFAILPRSIAQSGYQDIDADEHHHPGLLKDISALGTGADIRMKTREFQKDQPHSF